MQFPFFFLPFILFQRLTILTLCPLLFSQRLDSGFTAEVYILANSLLFDQFLFQQCPESERHTALAPFMVNLFAQLLYITVAEDFIIVFLQVIKHLLL